MAVLADCERIAVQTLYREPILFHAHIVSFQKKKVNRRKAESTFFPSLSERAARIIGQSAPNGSPKGTHGLIGSGNPNKILFQGQKKEKRPFLFFALIFLTSVYDESLRKMSVIVDPDN